MSTFFLLIGIWGVSSPHSWWLIGESWKSKRADGPSTFFIWCTRITGALFVVVGVIGIIAALS
ncbi:DUF6199 family natural product biosynthesis protein [Halobacillus salinus]|uniref:DUF6199 family natural product biosynthesis protein n=1 Tax=Halobacillus salinus TaxID=192814 RepID=UPI003BA976F5